MCLDAANRIVAVLDRSPMSCVVVDTDAEYRGHLAKVLEDLGFLVFCFGDGHEFERQCEECRFDVVILSWSVELLGGGVVESIRRAGKPYPALIIECDAGESVSLQLAIAPVGFLFKPFDARHLMEVLGKAVER